MDAIDRQLIEALRLNGRSSWAELGRGLADRFLELATRRPRRGRPLATRTG